MEKIDEEEEPVVNKVVKKTPPAQKIEPAPKIPVARKKRRACGVTGLGLLRHFNNL